MQSAAEPPIGNLCTDLRKAERAAEPNEGRFVMLGINAATFHGSLGCGLVDHAWLIRHAAQMGLGFVTIPPPAGNVPQALDLTYQRLRREACTADLNIHVLAGSLSPASFDTVLAKAVALGADLIQVSLGWRYPYKDMSQQAEIVQLAEQRIAKALPQLERAKLALAVENCGAVRSEELARLVDGFSHELVAVCLDTANSIALFESPLYTAKVLAPFARVVQLRDVKIGVGRIMLAEPTALGDGDIDLRHLVRAVERSRNPGTTRYQIKVPVGSRQAGRNVFDLENNAFERSLHHCTETLPFTLRRPRSARLTRAA